MPKYKKSFNNPYLFSNFTNNASEMFDYTMNNLMDNFYDSAMSTATDGKFKAVCLSGMTSEAGDGSGTKENDAGLVGKHLLIVVRPLTDFGSILPDPREYTDPNIINGIFSMHRSTFTARSDYEFKETDPVSFGQIVDCYFENGSIINSDFRTLRFSKPTASESDPSFESLQYISGVSTATAADWSSSNLLGTPEGDLGDIMTRAARVRAGGGKIRGTPRPTKNSGDDKLAQEIGIPTAVLRAFRSVESGPLGADALRFEPHLWYRKLSTDPPKGFTRNNEVVYSKVASETNKNAFTAAYAVNAKVAVQSTSFGLYQVLGGKGIKAYGSAQSFWSAFKKDPVAASDQMLKSWFKDNPKAIKAANDLDFTKLAEIYNGKQQAKHYYDALIAEAYQEALKL